MPGAQTGRCGGAQGCQRSPLRIGVANRAGACQNFAGLTDMAIIMASKAAGPVAVTDVVWIGRPVYLHGEKNISVINGENGVDGMVDLSLFEV